MIAMNAKGVTSAGYEYSEFFLIYFPYRLYEVMMSDAFSACCAAPRLLKN